MWYSYSMEYYSAIKRNEALIHVTTWINFENLVLSEKSYSCPLNNMGLNCAGPHILRFFSIVNTTVLYSLWLVESKDVEELQIQRDEYKLHSD